MDNLADHREDCTCHRCEAARFAATEFHPVQIRLHPHHRPEVSSLITQRAYEVYCELHGAQPAMMDLKGKDCRGGFGIGELVAYLYARSFPKAEWQKRFDEACTKING